MLVVYLVLGRMDTHFVRVFGCCTQPGEVVPSKDADTERRKKAQAAHQLKRTRRRALTKLQACGRLSGKAGGTWSPGKSKLGGLSNALGGVVSAARGATAANGVAAATGAAAATDAAARAAGTAARAAVTDAAAAIRTSPLLGGRVRSSLVSGSHQPSAQF